MYVFIKLLFTLACCTIVTCGTAFAQQIEPIDRILLQHDIYAKRITSLVSLFDSEYSVKRMTGWHTEYGSSIVVEANGNRYARESKRTDDKTGVKEQSLEINDGRKCYSLSGAYIDLKVRKLKFEEDQTPTATVYDQRPEPMSMPLNYGYKIENVWLSEYIRDNKLSFKRVVNDPKMGPLYELNGSDPHGGTINVWLAERMGFVVVRYEVNSKSKNKYIFQADNFKRLAELWLPDTASRSVYLGGNDLDSVAKLTKIKHIANQNFDKLFGFTLPGGSWFHEDDKRYMIGNNGEKILDQSYGGGRRDRRAKAMPLGWLFVGSLTSLILLSLGAFVKWRRQRSAFSS